MKKTLYPAIFFFVAILLSGRNIQAQERNQEADPLLTLHFFSICGDGCLTVESWKGVKKQFRTHKSKLWVYKYKFINIADEKAYITLAFESKWLVHQKMPLVIIIPPKRKITIEIGSLAPPTLYGLQSKHGWLKNEDELEINKSRSENYITIWVPFYRDYAIWIQDRNFEPIFKIEKVEK